MALNKQQWAAATQALPILEKKLEEKHCKLAATEGNRFRLAEKLADMPNVPVDPAKIADLFYSILVIDVNKVVNQPGYESSFFWQVKPPKLIAFERNKVRNTFATPTQPEKRERRVSTESSEERRENIQAMERVYDALGYISPRGSALRGFINEYKENSAYNTAEALKVVQKFDEERDWRVAVNFLQQHLAEVRA